MHVVKVVRKQLLASGEQRSYLLRHSFREDGKVKHQTLANLMRSVGPRILCEARLR
jgi:hypothetical protein